MQGFVKGVMSGVVQTQAQKSKAPAGGAAAGGAFPGLLPWPQVDFAKFGPIERKDLSRIKKISGANLFRNAVMIPAVTNHDDADITELDRRVEGGENVADLRVHAPLLEKAVEFLQQHPDVQAQFASMKNIKQTLEKGLVLFGN